MIKKLLLLLALLYSLDVNAATTRTAVQTDNFNDNDLTTGTVVWTQVMPGSSTCVNSSGSITFSGGPQCGLRADGTYSNDQYAKFSIAAFSGGSGPYYGVTCRASADTDGGRDFYVFYFNETGSGTYGDATIALVVNDGFTTLSSVTLTWSVSDTIEIECDGTAIRGLKNGTVQTTATNATLTTGKPGVWLYFGGQRLDNYEGGNLTAGSTAPVMRRMIQ